MDIKLIFKAHKTQEYFLRALSKEIFEEDGITAFAPNIPDPNLNLAMQTEEQVDLSDKTIQVVERFYQQFDLPWGWALSSAMSQQSLEVALKRQDYELLTATPVLVRFLEDFLPDDRLKYFNIKEVEQEKLSDWIAPLQEAFQATEQNAFLYQEAHIHALHQRADFHHFVAYADGIPVSAATLSLSPYGARLDDLGTLPAYQRKGFGTGLILYIMKRAKDCGYQGLFLETSDGGASLYKTLGFNELYRNKIYRKK